MCNWEIFCKKQEVPNPWSRASCWLYLLDEAKSENKTPKSP